MTLRRAIGAHATLVADRREVVLEGAGLDVDAVRFEALIAEGSAVALDAATTLYQGDLLEGIRVKEPPFEEWLLGERERIRELGIQALAGLLGLQIDSGHPGPAIRTAMRILSLDPVREAVHRDLMRLFDRQGRRGEALRQYRLCIDALQRELGVEPQSETRRLYQDIVRSARVPPSPPNVSPSMEGRGVARQDRAGAAAPGLSPALAGGPVGEPPPLIGRSSELSRLGQALEAAICGDGRLVVVLGEAGIGKSSLVEALEAEASRRGIPCHLGRSYLSEQVLAFAPWIDVLRAAGVVGDPELLACVGPAWIEPLARLIPDLKAGSSERAEDGSPQQLFEAIVHLVACLAAAEPRLILLEDIHWADEMSLRLLAFVARRIGSARALLVATAREEEVAGDTILSRVLDELGADPRVDRIGLPPLSREDTAALVQSLAGPGAEGAATARLAERIFTASGGNPFMVVETMRALADGTIAEDSAGSTLPERVRHVITGRLARLGERSRNLLAAAAAIGREFDFALLHAAAGLDEAAAAEDIEALVRRRILRVVGERFDFVHDQVREVVYGQLLPPRRALLHAAVARAIERRHAGHLGDHVERLAHHAFRGELWNEAVIYGRRAGHIAAERSAHAQASACFARALQALAQLPESRQALEQAIELREFRTSHHFALGERTAYLECVEEAVTLAERLGDDRWLARVVATQANALWFAGDNRAALESGLRAVALAESIGEPEALIRATLNLGLICNTLGDYQQAAARLARTAALAGGQLERERLGRTLYPAVTARGELARAQAELGQFDAAAATLGEAIRIAETLQHSTTLLVARLDGCHVRLCRGDWGGAIPALEACLHAFRAAGLTGFGVGAAGMLGYAQAMTGHPGEGIRLLREAIEQAAQGRRTREALFTMYLSEALLLAQHGSEATTLGERALVLSRERFERGTEARARYVLGEIAAAAVGGDRQAAEHHYRDALGLAGELGMRPLVALCHLGLGRLERDGGERRASRLHLATATAMFRELGMAFWLGQAGGSPG